MQADVIAVRVVVVEGPIRGRFGVPHFQPSAAWRQVGLVGRGPEIEADVGLVGMDVGAWPLVLADERPPVSEMMLPQQLRQRGLEFGGELEQERADKSRFRICTEITLAISAPPDSRFEAEALQLCQCRRRQQVVDAGYAPSTEGLRHRRAV